MKHVLLIPLAALATFLPQGIMGQWIGGHMEGKGNYIEMCLGQCGNVGCTVAPPPGYHPSPGFPGLGLVGDVGKDGWVTYTPPMTYNYCGDYVQPGVPIEGWSLTFNGNHYINSNVGCSSFGIPGELYFYISTPGDDTLGWIGKKLGLAVENTWIVPQNNLFALCFVELRNDTSFTLTNVHYGRNIDSDGEYSWGGGYVTSNTVIRQPVAGVSDTAIVQSIGSTGQCRLYIASVDARASVNHGGSATPSAEDLYLGTGRTTTVGVTGVADEAIGIGFQIGDMAPGDVAFLKLAYVLDSAELALAMARMGPPCTLLEDSISVTACDSFLFNGNVLTSSGSYIDTLTSVVSGCDSVVHLDLTVNYGLSTFFAATACGRYVFDDDTLVASGMYTATLTTSTGCDSIVTIDLTIDAPVDTTVTLGGGTLSAAAGLTYQWLDCDSGFAPIAGATGQDFTPSINGHYAVMLTNGTCIDTSGCTEVIVVGRADPFLPEVSVTPNPVHERAWVEFSSPLQVVEVECMGVTGSILLSKVFQNARLVSIDLSLLPPGVYFLRIHSDHFSKVVKVMKQ